MMKIMYRTGNSFIHSLPILYLMEDMSVNKPLIALIFNSRRVGHKKHARLTIKLIESLNEPILRSN